MIRGLLVGIVAAPIVGATLAYSLAEWDFEPKNNYAFETPAMVLKCIDFPVPDQSEWTIPSWKFEQAVRLNFLDFKGTLNMPGSYYLTPCDLNFSAKSDVKHITFGADGSVTVERY